MNSNPENSPEEVAKSNLPPGDEVPPGDEIAESSDSKSGDIPAPTLQDQNADGEYFAQWESHVDGNYVSVCGWGDSSEEALVDYQTQFKIQQVTARAAQGLSFSDSSPTAEEMLPIVATVTEISQTVGSAHGIKRIPRTV
jgi:hypothetical protein